MDFFFDEGFLFADEVFVIFFAVVEVSGLTHLLPPKQIDHEDVVFSEREVLDILLLECI